MALLSNKRLLAFLSMCVAAITANTQTVTPARECVEGFYSRLQQGLKNAADPNAENSITIIDGVKKYVEKGEIFFPDDLAGFVGGRKKYRHNNLSDYIDRLAIMFMEDSNCEMSFKILTEFGENSYLDYFFVLKTFRYNGKYFEFIDWVHVNHREHDVAEDYKILKIAETATIHIVGYDGKPLTSVGIHSAESGNIHVKESPNNRGDFIIGIVDTASKIIITATDYSDTIFYTIRRGERYTIQLKQYEKVRFHLFVPVVFPVGNFGKGFDNWINGGNAWSNYPFDLAYFFEDNKSLSKAAMGMGFGLGAKAIIPIKKSTTSMIVQTEYLLTPSSNGKMLSHQTTPAEVLYYQYNPSSGMNNIKVLEVDMNVSFPRLNTIDVMLGVNKKFRNFIGSSHLELEGAVGTAWHWSSDLSGNSTIPGDFSFITSYEIFSKAPSFAFEAGLTLALGEHLSLGLNYVNLGGFDVKGHASWNSTIIPSSDANNNNVDFHFGRVTVHYMSLVLGCSFQNK